ncbi:hypothetical protein [Paenibacillus odorifer]|uniref:hypothetical protein n=1 Tax=Paenibacillus odorifer TaxID=189426 RepID=UPI00096C6384|nr:hypothetical protein [Paenibacillus odorifer]OMD67621.1 hypothetical protein BSK50_30085 [Paenibacillus odorifer]
MGKKIKRIQAIKRELEAKRTALMDIPVGEITEEEEEKLYKELNDKISQAIEAEYDAKLKVIRTNEWANQFLMSFEKCNSKKISLKQVEVFEKNMSNVKMKSDFNTFHGTARSRKMCSGIYEGKVYEISIFHDCGYLTVRDTVVI